MKTENLSKKEAEQVLKNGGEVFLYDENTFLKGYGINKDKFYDQTGFNFTNWFYLYAPEKGWNMKIN